ncbi:membrane associated subtilisin-like serine protease, partial [Lacticaseibacillus paracasei subsp. paracasei Lpp123]
DDKAVEDTNDAKSAVDSIEDAQGNVSFDDATTPKNDSSSVVTDTEVKDTLVKTAVLNDKVPQDINEEKAAKPETSSQAVIHEAHDSVADTDSSDKVNASHTALTATADEKIDIGAAFASVLTENGKKKCLVKRALNRQLQNLPLNQKLREHLKTTKIMKRKSVRTLPSKPSERIPLNQPLMVVTRMLQRSLYQMLPLTMT